MASPQDNYDLLESSCTAWTLQVYCFHLVWHWAIHWEPVRVECVGLWPQLRAAMQVPHADEDVAAGRYCVAVKLVVFQSSAAGQPTTTIVILTMSSCTVSTCCAYSACATGYATAELWTVFMSTFWLVSHMGLWSAATITPFMLYSHTP